MAQTGSGAEVVVHGRRPRVSLKPLLAPILLVAVLALLSWACRNLWFVTLDETAVALGDLNGDGFPDAALGNRGLDEIWLNDGRGNFTRAQKLGGGVTWSVSLADLDDDGDLDLVTGGETSGRVWLNGGKGHFSRGQRIPFGRYESIAVGELTGDGVVDILAAGVDSYQVWHGRGDGRFDAGLRLARINDS